MKNKFVTLGLLGTFLVLSLASCKNERDHFDMKSKTWDKEILDRELLDSTIARIPDSLLLEIKEVQSADPIATMSNKSIYSTGYKGELNELGSISEDTTNGTLKLEIHNHSKLYLPDGTEDTQMANSLTEFVEIYNDGVLRLHEVMGSVGSHGGTSYPYSYIRGDMNAPLQEDRNHAQQSLPVTKQDAQTQVSAVNVIFAKIKDLIARSKK